MIQDRNPTSHTYDRKLAEEVFDRLADHYRVLEQLRSKMG